MTRILMTGAAALALLVACDGPGSTRVEETSSNSPELGDFGVDLSARDLSVEPGEDFNLYANGSWISEYEIPADRSRFGSFDILRERATEQVKSIIEDIASQDAPEGSDRAKASALYESFMNAERLEELGTDPIKADLAFLRNLQTKEDLARAMMRADISAASIFGAGAGIDRKNPGFHTLYVSQSGLGLPDRDYYLKDDEKFTTIRAEYQSYLETLFELVGFNNIEDRAATVLKVETAIAEMHWPRAKSRNRDLTYNPFDLAALEAYAPGFPWAAALDELGAPDQEKIVLSQNDAIRDLAAYFDAMSVYAWKNYLFASYLRSNASYLPKAFDEADFAFYGTVLRGQPEQRERWKRASDFVSRRMGDVIGKTYVERHFPPVAKERMDDLVANLVAAFEIRIDELDWMSDETKAEARDKLSKFTPKIGYPAEWEDYSALEIAADDLLGNVKRHRVWARAENIKKLDEPVDPTEWGRPPQTVNAWYSAQRNDITFPAAILQPPFFDPYADPAVNYGAIGGVIGHEIGHGFDDQGRKSDGDGNQRNWWTAADAERFEERAQMLIDQYGAFEPIPGRFVNGELTLGENIGDLGGLTMAYHAYKLSLNGEEPPVIDGLTGDQRFFLSWAQVWKGKRREDSLLAQLLSDPHSPARYRINGVVRNMDEWYDAFEVDEDDALYLPPEERVRIW